MRMNKEEIPEYIYKVFLNVTPDGSFQKNIIKNRVDKITSKNYIIAKNTYHIRSVHVDRDLVGGDVNVSIGIGFSKAVAWCTEEAIDETAERVRQALLQGLEDAGNSIFRMETSVTVNNPDVTERDTTEFD